MLIVPINDEPAAIAELIILMMLPTALALPVVALPAVVLFATVALPLAALRFASLVIPVLLLRFWVFVFVAVFVLVPPAAPSIAAIIIGYKAISPFTFPLIFEVNVAGAPAPPDSELLTMFVKVVAAAAVPVVALPAWVLLMTPAFPDVDVAPIVLPIVFVFAALVVVFVFTVFVLLVGVVTGAEDDDVGELVVVGVVAPAGGVIDVVTTG